MMHEIVRARAALTAILEKQGGGKVLRRRPAAHHLRAEAARHSPIALRRVKYLYRRRGNRQAPSLWLSMVVDKNQIHRSRRCPTSITKSCRETLLVGEEFEGIRLFDEKILCRPDAQREQQVAQLKERMRLLQAEAIRARSDAKAGSVGNLSVERDLTRLKKQLAALVPRQTHEQIELDAEKAWRRLARLQQLHEQILPRINRKKKRRSAAS